MSPGAASELSSTSSSADRDHRVVAPARSDDLGMQPDGFVLPLHPDRVRT